MPKSDFSFFYPLRVRWAEVDLQKVVFNAHYLLYFDIAFTEYWRACELPDALTQHQQGKELFVKRANLEYHAPALYDDALNIGVRCSRLGNSSMNLLFEIYRAQECLVSGELLYIYADPLAKKGVSLPPEWRKRLKEMERLAPDASQ